MPTPAIAIEHLTKRYGRLVAVRDLTLEVAQGEIFGFLGLNGAGKTTTIRVLLDLLRPTAGRAALLGHDCQADGLRARAQVGYLPGEIGWVPDMRADRVLDVLAALAGTRVDAGWRQQLLDRLELSGDQLRRRVRELSTGMKRKIGIVQAFQVDPPLLILDEPTEGLDPLMQESFYALLAEVRARGRTVFMSSHVLSEVERVCDRIGLLRAGELVLQAPVDEVRHLVPREIQVSFGADVPGPSGLPPAFAIVAVTPRSWTLRVPGPLGPLVTGLAGMPVVDVAIKEPHLEEVVMRYYR